MLIDFLINNPIPIIYIKIYLLLSVISFWLLLLMVRLSFGQWSAGADNKYKFYLASIYEIGKSMVFMCMVFSLIWPIAILPATINSLVMFPKKRKNYKPKFSLWEILTKEF